MPRRKNNNKQNKQPVAGNKPQPAAVQEVKEEPKPETSNPAFFQQPGREKELALEYVNMIRKEFSSTPEVYTEFTQILKDFDGWKYFPYFNFITIPF